MPRKIRELVRDLKKSGWYLDWQKGSHRVFKHPKLAERSKMRGKPSDRYALFVSWSDGNAAHRNREECRPRPFDDPVVGSPLA